MNDEHENLPADPTQPSEAYGEACPVPRADVAPRSFDRRSFLTWAATASLGASAFFVLATLAEALLPPSRSIDGMTEVGPLTVARVSDLKSGVPVMVDYGDDKLYVVRAGTDVKAFDAACPHARCTLKFNSTLDRFDCPCHGSAFTIEGRKIQGPSPRDMVSATVKIVNGDVVVSGFSNA